MIFKHCEFDGLESQLVGKWEKPVGSSTEYEAFIVEASVWGRQGVIGAIEFEESGGDLPLFHLDDFEDDRIFEEDAKDVENAHHHPRFNCGQALRFGRISGHTVEDVNQHQKQGDEESHPSCKNQMHHKIYCF